MEMLTDGGWVSNAQLLIIVVGYTLVGLIVGGFVGYERAERKGYERQQRALDEAWHYWEEQKAREERRASA